MLKRILHTTWSRILVFGLLGAGIGWGGIFLATLLTETNDLIPSLFGALLLFTFGAPWITFILLFENMFGQFSSLAYWGGNSLTFLFYFAIGAILGEAMHLVSKKIRKDRR